jgi:hypothetical protein
VIDILGTSQNATIKDWYSSPGEQLSEIRASGLTLTNDSVNSQLASLVQAMANYTSSHIGFDPTNPTLTQMPAEIQTSLPQYWPVN